LHFGGKKEVMQPQDSLSVARRPLDVEDYIDILRRHRGWIFAPFLLVLVGTVVAAFLWPDTYVSQAVVKVVPQQVPEKLVESNVNQQIADRINSMAQSILSRTVLTSIINTFDLYERERARMPIEDVIEEMRRNVSVNPIGATAGNKTVPAFSVSFSYRDRYKAQKVVQDLVSKFMDQNTRERSSVAILTTRFLKDQLDTAKKELESIEQQLAEFRMQNQGRLPEQMAANMNQISALNQNVANLNAAINRVNQEKLLMESQLRILRDTIANLTRDTGTSADPMVTIQKSQRAAELDRDIERMENTLATLRQTYKDTYPDIQRLQGMIEIAKKNREEILKEEQAPAAKPASDAPRRAVSPQALREIRDAEAQIKRLQSQLEAKEIEQQQYQKDIQAANAQIKQLQARIEGVPMGEKVYMELLRNRDLAQAKANELDLKMSKSKIAEEMEGRKQGETLELLDPASLPQTPAKPKRPMVVGIGAGVGLLLGLVLAGAREVKDTSLKNLKDVRAYTNLAILGSVPLLENEFVVRRRRRIAWLGWTIAILLSLLIMAGSVVYYYTTRA
jgi:polysaccharide chain length determinant protein (PEP-CTERM system associated)